MKKLIFIALVALTSCKTVYVNLGMPENEFTSKYCMAENVQLSASGDIYRMLMYVNGRRMYKFFYFEQSKLVRVDEGERQPDVVIQNN